jgi:hypothetical protein
MVAIQNCGFTYDAFRLPSACLSYIIRPNGGNKWESKSSGTTCQTGQGTSPAAPWTWTKRKQVDKVSVISSTSFKTGHGTKIPRLLQS